MSDLHQTTAGAKGPVDEALVKGRRKVGNGGAGPAAGPQYLLAMQRSAGNAAVNALMSARLRSPAGPAVTEIEAALVQIRRDEPAIDTVEKGLRAAQTAGVPVDLEGPKPPASALAVTKTGFGPGSVAEKKPTPSSKPVPTVNPLGRAGSVSAKVGGGTPGKAPTAPPAGAGGAAPTMGAAPLAADKLLRPPVAPTPTRPDDDPAFHQVTGSINAFAQQKKSHPSAASKAKEAQAAAQPPADHIAAQAKAAKVDTMDAQPAGSFDKKAFIAAVKAAIEAKSPKTLKEADNYRESGKAGEVKGEVKVLVSTGKHGQSKDIEAATDAPPDTSKAVPKPVTPMAQEDPGHAAPIPAAGAVPRPAPAEQVNLEAGKAQANQELADGEVTESQLSQSNEPEFQQALVDKKAAAAQADTAPGEFRAHEKAAIEQGNTDAAAETAAGVTGMQGAKGAALANLVADKSKTKSKDETRRAEVTTKIQGIFAATEAEVKKILDGLDPKVEAAFEQGEIDARSSFESYVTAKMAAYKEDRYSGWLGGLRWAKDKLLGMPDKVNDFYEAGRELYLKKMDGVISRVADIVAGGLNAAKARIAAGRAEIAAYVKSLPTDLQKVGAEASQEIGEKFAQLESDVNAKQESLVDTLAAKYVEARKGLDERIEALQAENKGLVDRAIGAIKAVINTIRELVAMLKNVLSRVAGVVGEIIKKPVEFLGNLIAGIKGGILKFKDNILDHLRKGLMSWLFGALAEGGVELPEKFDVKGIVKLLASIFGLTWTNIRNRVVKKIGEKAMGAAEKGVGLFQVIAREGISGLWEMLVEKLGDIKEMILEQVKDFVITKIITAGITWLIGLLNPAAAFIKACKLIYDVVMFFVDNAGRIAKFVNTVIDSVADIVRGNVSGVVNKINDVLGQMVPIIIGFLASVIGLGGIGAKIRQIVETLQKPVNKALDFVINTGLKLAGPIIRGLKGIGGKVKSKVGVGKAWVKGKAKAGKQWLTDRAEAGTSNVQNRFGPEPKKPGQASDDRDLISAASAGDAIVRRPGIDRGTIRKELPDLRVKYGLSNAQLITEPDGEVHVTVQKSSKSSPSRIIQESLTRVRIHTMIRNVANELLESNAVKEGVQKILQDREKRRVSPEAPPRANQGKAVEARAVIYHGRAANTTEVITALPGVTTTDQQKRTSKPGHIHVLGLGKGGTYSPDIVSALSAIKARTGASDAQISKAVRDANDGKIPEPPIGSDQQAVGYLARIARLEAVESGRSPSHLVGSAMAHQVVEGESGTTAEQMVTDFNPMAIEGAGAAARRVSRDEAVPHPSPSQSVGSGRTVQEFLRREMSLAIAFVETVFDKEHGGDFSEKELNYMIRHQLQGRLERAAREDGGIRR